MSGFNIYTWHYIEHIYSFLVYKVSLTFYPSVNYRYTNMYDERKQLVKHCFWTQLLFYLTFTQSGRIWLHNTSNLTKILLLGLYPACVTVLFLCGNSEITFTITKLMQFKRPMNSNICHSKQVFCIQIYLFLKPCLVHKIKLQAGLLYFYTPRIVLRFTICALLQITEIWRNFFPTERFQWWVLQLGKCTLHSLISHFDVNRVLSAVTYWTIIPLGSETE